MSLIWGWEQALGHSARLEAEFVVKLQRPAHVALEESQQVGLLQERRDAALKVVNRQGAVGAPPGAEADVPAESPGSRRPGR